MQRKTVQVDLVVPEVGQRIRLARKFEGDFMFIPAEATGQVVDVAEDHISIKMTRRFRGDESGNQTIAFCTFDEEYANGINLGLCPLFGFHFYCDMIDEQGNKITYLPEEASV